LDNTGNEKKIDVKAGPRISKPRVLKAEVKAGNVYLKALLLDILFAYSASVSP
jgi:hypothetical protein